VTTSSTLLGEPTALHAWLLQRLLLQQQLLLLPLLCDLLYEAKLTR
jgi:hypothetical protein